MKLKPQIAYLSSILLASLALTITFTVLYGWLAKIPSLVQVSPNLNPMQPNTAIAFAILCIGFLTDQILRKFIISTLCSSFALLLGVLTIFEFVLNTNSNIDTFFIEPFLIHISSMPGRMALNSAISLTLLSIASLASHSLRRSTFYLLSCFPLLISGAIGLVSILGYYFDLEVAYSWSGYIRMSPLTAVTICLTSTSFIIAFLFRAPAFGRSKTFLVAISFFVTGMTASALLWAYVTAEQIRFMQSEMRSKANYVTNLINFKISGDIELLKSIERFFSSSEDVNSEEFSNFVAPLLNINASIVAIDWTPRTRKEERIKLENEISRKLTSNIIFKQLGEGTELINREQADQYFPVLYSEPPIQHQKVLGFDHGSDPLRLDAMEKAYAKRGPVSTSLLKLFRLEETASVPSDFLIFMPTFKVNKKREEFLGYIVGVFRSSLLVSEALSVIQDDDFEISFSDADSPSMEPFLVYRNQTLNSDTESNLTRVKASSELLINQKLVIAGREWKLNFTPTPAYLKSLRSWYPSVLLIVSVVSTTLIAFYILALRRQNEKINIIAEERTSEVKRQADVVDVQQEIALAGHDIAKLLNVITKRVEDTTRADGAVIEILEGNELVYIAASGLAAPYLGLRVHIDKSLSDLCIKTAGVLKCDDTEIDERVDSEACRKIGIRSMLVVPLISQGKALGVIKVLSHEATYFHEKDATTLQLMAGVIAAAISNASAVKALKESEDKLRSATEFKTQFLANMSHEIRSPLTGIIGFAESLMNNDLKNEEKDGAYDLILRNSKHLLGIINDILDLSKIEAGKLGIEILQVSLLDLISDVGNLMKHKANEKGLHFSFDYVFPLPEIVLTDPLRLKQILINLISNAIKFTKSGSVKVVVSIDSSNDLMLFSVVDTGIGLSLEQQNKLFQAFSQADTSTTRQFGGTGLGLVISYQLAQKLGGTIQVLSSPHIGSTFSLSIHSENLHNSKMIYSTPPSRTQSNSTNINSATLTGRVLLAEDGPDNQRYISFVLKKANLDFTIVENGALAVELAKKEHFDLILMDMQMPVMDGYTATKTLRKNGCYVPIIALTANIMKQDVIKCLDAGCTDFLGKPFERKDFYDKIKIYLKEDLSDNQNSGEALFTEVDDIELMPIILKFISSFPQRIKEIETALENHDWDTLQMCAHRLRGAAPLNGYKTLGEIAGSIEDHIADSHFEAVPELIKELKSTCSRITKGRRQMEGQTNHSHV